ncbi:MAG: hypothetical protein ISN29_11475 [Gammaproteobacteria bacterium AqS3]|nr:hypothetical protein [Gammaproteobacteria bacterium AqS3]
MEKPNITMVPVPKKKHGFRGKGAQAAVEVEDRSAQVMDMVRSGMSLVNVAEELGITRQTVSRHFQRGMAMLRESIIDNRLDLLILETEKLEMIRESYTEAALKGDIQSAGVVLKVHERISNLWGLDKAEVIARLPSEQAHNVKDEEGENKDVVDVIRDHLDVRVIDTETDLWAEVSPSVMGFLDGKSLEEHATYITALAIPIMQEAVVPIRKSLPHITGAEDFKGMFAQSGTDFIAVDSINGHDPSAIIEAVNAKRDKGG